jgi:hypothetical protein
MMKKKKMMKKKRCVLSDSLHTESPILVLALLPYLESKLCTCSIRFCFEAFWNIKGQAQKKKKHGFVELWRSKTGQFSKVPLKKK